MADLQDDPSDTDSTAAVGDIDAPPEPPAPAATAATGAAPASSAERARELLAAYPVFDGHNSLAPTLLRRRGANHRHDLDEGETFLDTDMPRIRAGALGAQFWALHVDADAVREGRAVSTTLELIDLVRDLIASSPDSLRLALGAGSWPTPATADASPHSSDPSRVRPWATRSPRSARSTSSVCAHSRSRARAGPTTD